MFNAFISTTLQQPANKTKKSYLRKSFPAAASQDPVRYLKPHRSQSVGQNQNEPAMAKRLRKLVQIAYYQAGKIVIQTLLPQHPPIALISLNLSGITTTTSADTYIPFDNTSNAHWCSFLESRLIGLYSGKATCSLLEITNCKTSANSAAIPCQTYGIGKAAKGVAKQTTPGPGLAMNKARKVNTFASGVTNHLRKTSNRQPPKGVAFKLNGPQTSSTNFMLPLSFRANRSKTDKFNDTFAISFCDVGNRINTIINSDTFDNSISGISRAKIGWTQIKQIKPNFHSGSEMNAAPTVLPPSEDWQPPVPRLVLKNNTRLKCSFTNSKNGTWQGKTLKNSRLSTLEKINSHRRTSKMNAAMPKLKIKKFFFENGINEGTSVARQSDIGHLEIQLATYLATTMIHKWFFYSLQFSQYAPLHLFSWCNKPFKINLSSGPALPPSEDWITQRVTASKARSQGPRLLRMPERAYEADTSPSSKNTFLKERSVYLKRKTGNEINESYINRILDTGVNNKFLDKKPIESQPFNPKSVQLFSKKYEKPSENHTIWSMVSTLSTPTLSMSAIMSTLHYIRGVKTHHKKVGLDIGFGSFSTNKTLGSITFYGCTECTANSKINTTYNGPASPDLGLSKQNKLGYLLRNQQQVLDFFLIFWACLLGKAANVDKDYELNHEIDYQFSYPHVSLRGSEVDYPVNHKKEKLSFALSLSKLDFPKKKEFTYSSQRISVENVGEKFSSQIDAFQLINPLQFSNTQRERFYPGWFRLYLPDIEATEFIKNVANFYYNLGLQTLVRPSLTELILFTSSVLPITQSSTPYQKYFSPLPCNAAVISLPSVKPRFDKSGHSSFACEAAVLQCINDINIVENGCAGFVNSTLFCPVDFAFLKKEKLFDNFVNKQIQPFNKDEDSLVTHDPQPTKPLKNLREPALQDLTSNSTKTMHATLTSLPKVAKLGRQPKTVAVQEQVSYEKNNELPAKLANNLGLKGTNNVVSPENTNSQDTAYSTSILQNTFFCYGNNDLSVGVGLLRNGAKRRNQLNKKSQHFYKLKATLKEVFYPIDSVRSLDNVHIFLALWGFSRPWHINRLINISFKPGSVSGLAISSEMNPAMSAANKELTKKPANRHQNNTIKIENVVPYPGSLEDYEVTNEVDWQNKKQSRHKKQNNNEFLVPMPAVHPPNVQDVMQPKEKVNYVVNNEVDYEFANEFETNNQINLGKFASQFSRIKQITQSCSTVDVSSALLLEKQIFPISYSAISSCANQEKELICHTLVNNCFAKTCLLVDQNRQVIDYFADYLIRFQILRQHQILYIFSTILLNCQKKKKNSLLMQI